MSLLPVGIGSSGDYEISRSVRLRSSASAYFTRTNSTTGTSNTTLTVSAWVKRGEIGERFPIFGTYQLTNAFFTIWFNNSDILAIRNRNSAGVDLAQLESKAVFRDTSAWYHVVAVYDSTQATASNRCKLYVNGVQLTSFTTATYPALNTVVTGTTLTSPQIGRTSINTTPTVYYADGYIADLNFIDGQALDPSYFGETDAVTGVWKPKKYTGTYGTNGFFLNFSDNSAATAAAIGKDYSGNGNDWTPNNISLTAGTTYDSMLDVPTQWADGGNGRGNYAVMNPLDGVLPTVTNGNLQVSIGAGTTSIDCGTMAVTSGKWYWEVSPSTISNNAMRIGVSDYDLALSGRIASAAGGWAYVSTGNKVNNGTSVAYGSAYTTSNIIGVALDMDTGTLEFFEDGVSQGVAYSTGLAGKLIGPSIGSGTGAGAQAAAFNFGQRPFSYTPPTGFKALNALNLPTPTILKGNQYFDATTYTGNGGTQSITNSGSMQPDLVWIKQRNTARSHRLHDSVRGVSKQLFSDTTGAETSNTDELTSFNSDGFTLSTSAGVNANAATYVGWQWKANGTPAVTNTAGSITSQVSVGGTQGFSVVTYTGTGSAATVGHGLGVAPSMIIVKNRDNGTVSWVVYHKEVDATNPENYMLWLNLTNARSSSSATGWNSTAPTSSVFSINNYANNNQSGSGMVAYCFSEVAGFSKFGSYTGNGSTNGPFVFCGFRPRFVLIKLTSAASGSWAMLDTERDQYNLSDAGLFAESSNAEAVQASTNSPLDILSNGFKCRGTGTASNLNGATYIFAAFAEHPFKNALAR